MSHILNSVIWFFETFQFPNFGIAIFQDIVLLFKFYDMCFKDFAYVHSIKFLKLQLLL